MADVCIKFPVIPVILCMTSTGKRAAKNLPGVTDASIKCASLTSYLFVFMFKQLLKCGTCLH